MVVSSQVVMERANAKAMRGMLSIAKVCDKTNGDKRKKSNHKSLAPSVESSVSVWGEEKQREGIDCTTKECRGREQKKSMGLNGAQTLALAAADRRFVELGALIMLGREADPEAVRYTIPAPMRGLRFAGVMG